MGSAARPTQSYSRKAILIHHTQFSLFGLFDVQLLIIVILLV